MNPFTVVEPNTTTALAGADQLLHVEMFDQWTGSDDSLPAVCGFTAADVAA